MAIIKWESPRRDLDSFGRTMRRFFNDFDSNFTNFTPFVNNGNFMPSVDINEDKDNIYFIAELPGLTKDDVKLTVSEGVLTIRGEKKREEEHQDRNFYRMERSYGEFVRQFTLPEGVKEENIQADFKDGVLEIMVPKKEPSKPKEREVPIQSGMLHNGKSLSKTTNGQREKAMA
ncbi:MAG TPA: Hsp20/alpha crystallin family protein [Candidatus Kapabacteria bacterium]|nr:Hsp20/alpha crystallin family protein [Candidatus Kapabacteria bacterium]